MAHQHLHDIFSYIQTIKDELPDYSVIFRGSSIIAIFSNNYILELL
jgi:hypothetical protein